MKYAIVSLISVFALSQCSKKESPSTDTKDIAQGGLVMEYQSNNKSVLFEFTSTGCPGCGSWGKPTVENMKAIHGDKVVPMAIHIKYNDIYITDVSQAIADNRVGSRWTPQLWMNNENTTILENGYISGQKSMEAMNTEVDNKTQDANISLGGAVKLIGRDFTGKYGLKLNKEAGKEYYLSAYLMEENLMSDQQGSTNNPVLHHGVIRKAADGVWGKKIVANSSNQTFEYELTHDFSNANHYMAVVLWEKVGTRYLVVDAAEFKQK
jgi:hypothetical protein